MSLRHLVLLSAVMLLPAAGVHAVPLEYSPPSAPHEARVEFGAGSAPDNEIRLDDSLISARAAKALMVSEMRTRALAEGTAPPADGDARARSSDRARHPRQDAYVQADPLALALKRMMNHQEHSGGAAPAPGAASQPTAPVVAALGFDDGDAPVVVLADGDEIVERIANVRQTFADALSEAIALSVNADGEATFSVMGLEGFSASFGQGQMSLMFRDVTLFSAGGGVRAGVSSGAQGHPSRQGGSDGDRTLLYRLLFLLWDILTHPLTLATLVALAVARLLAGLARSGPAF